MLPRDEPLGSLGGRLRLFRGDPLLIGGDPLLIGGDALLGTLWRGRGGGIANRVATYRFAALGAVELHGVLRSGRRPIAGAVPVRYRRASRDGDGRPTLGGGGGRSGIRPNAGAPGEAERAHRAHLPRSPAGMGRSALDTGGPGSRLSIVSARDPRSRASWCAQARSPTNTCFLRFISP